MSGICRLPLQIMPDFQTSRLGMWVLGCVLKVCSATEGYAPEACHGAERRTSNVPIIPPSAKPLYTVFHKLWRSGRSRHLAPERRIQNPEGPIEHLSFVPARALHVLGG